MRQAVAGDAMTFLEADGGVVNDRVEPAERVDLARDVPCAGDGLEVADDDRLGRGQGAFGVGRAGCVAGVERDPMALIGEELPGHQARARRTNPK